ncbi:MAG: hypothetical protein AAF573_09260 [Bacteroidota bacterium]
MKKVTKLTTALVLFTFISISLQAQLYYPTSVKSPFFTDTERFMVEAGTNNYALDFSVNYQVRRFIFSLQHDYNNENLSINPLNLNTWDVQGIETHRIQSSAEMTEYSEMQIGHSPNLKKIKLEGSLGIGRNWNADRSRYFAQVAIGNENRFIDAGLVVRGTYVEDLTSFISDVTKNVVVLEPAIIGRIKVGRFRIINQFGYSMIMDGAEDYMKPNFRIGLGYKY